MTASAYAQAIADVKARVEASQTSFHMGMSLLPRKRREAMYALYAFCRAVDDIADESPSAEVATSGLRDWRIRIADVFKGQASEAITTALLPALSSFCLVEKDFQEIIDGMEMDVTPIVAPDAATLDLYCDRVASAVGRVSVRIFGSDGEEALTVAHHLGRAFQLTNILRDLSEDAVRGRLYLPRDLLKKHGIVSKVPADVLKAPRLFAVCRDLADQALAHYQKADVGMNGRLATILRPARMMRVYYGAILDKLIREDWQDPSARVRLSKWEKALLVVKGFFL